MYSPGAPPVLCDIRRFSKLPIVVTRREALVCLTRGSLRATFITASVSTGYLRGVWRLPMAILSCLGFH